MTIDMKSGTGYRRWPGLIAASMILLSGCTANPRSDPPSYGDWRATSAEPVDRIRFSNLIDWQPLDRDWISLRFNGGRAFAVRPRDPCLADVREARTLELVSAMPNLLHRSDQVRLDDKLCMIEEIRTLSSTSGTAEAVGGSGYISASR